MPTYLYGLILPRNAPRIPAGAAGIGGSVLRQVECGPVVAIVSDVETAPASSDMAAVSAHDAALRALAGAGITVAAVRFGQSFAAEGDLRTQLVSRAPALASRLAALDGCVEMRLLLPMDAVPMMMEKTPAEGTGPGRSYLEGLRRSVHVTGVTLREVLGPLVLGERVEVHGRDGMSFAHLVRTAEVDAYKAAVAALPSLGKGIVVGPLPLYSFAPEIDG